MMTSQQHVVAYVWHETVCHETIAEPVDTIHHAERRATLMFDLLLTYLAEPEYLMPSRSPM
jgi:hypothetical protein